MTETPTETPTTIVTDAEGTPPTETPPVPPTEAAPPVETPPPPPTETPPPVTTTGLENLSAELLGHDRLKGVESVEDLANLLVNAELAQQKIAPDGYTLPEGAPAELGQFAHDNNLSQEQLDGVMSKLVTMNADSNTAQRTKLANDGQAKLVEWGEASKENVSLAVNAVDYMESKTPGVKEMLETTGYGNHPIVLEVFKEVGLMVKEGGFLKSDTLTPASKKTPAQRMFPSQES